MKSKECIFVMSGFHSWNIFHKNGLLQRADNKKTALPRQSRKVAY